MTATTTNHKVLVELLADFLGLKQVFTDTTRYELFVHPDHPKPIKAAVLVHYDGDSIVTVVVTLDGEKTIDRDPEHSNLEATLRALHALSEVE